MSRRTSGTIFCAISAFILSSCYLCAAIQCAARTSWSSQYFRDCLKVTGSLQFLGAVALVVGIIYLIAAEVVENRSKDKT
jgi:hypothetical protein